MSLSKEELFNEAGNLSPMEKAQLVEFVLSTFNLKGRKEIDSLWSSEAEERLHAAKSGDLEKISTSTQPK